MMSEVKSNQKIEMACEDALGKFKKISIEKYADIQSKLEYVLGSYRFDKNPVGLFEIGESALKELKNCKKGKPRLVSKKLIDSLAKALKG